MIGLDTNVLVRYIMQDDASQSRLATAVMESLHRESPGFVAMTAVVELVWVLSAAYDLDKTEVAAAIDGLLRTDVLRVERSELIWQALKLFAGGKADFADCLIALSGQAADCECTMTFDRAAARDAGMRLIH